MMDFKRTGRLLTVTALAASTAMTGPLSALAQEPGAPPPVVRGEAPEAPAERPREPEAPRSAEPEAPAERPAPRREREPEPEGARAPEPEAPAERPAPRREPAAEAPEAAPGHAREPEAPAERPVPRREPAAEAPARQERAPEAAPERAREPEAPAERPAPRRERAPEAQPEPEAAPPRGDAERPRQPDEPAGPRAPAERQAPAPDAPAAEPRQAPARAAPDSGPPANAPQGNPVELPRDAGTQNDLSNGVAPAPQRAAPAEAPARATPPAPPAGAGETPAAPPAAAPGVQPPTPPAPGAEPPAPGASPAEPVAPPTAPNDPALRTPNGAPVAPGTPPAPPALPAGAVPAPAPGVAPDGTVPATPVPGQQSGAVAPPPVENPQPVAADVQTAPVPEGGVAASDARVQQLAAPVQVRPITAEQGQRLEAPPQVVLPNNVQVVERVGDRDVLSLVGAGIAGAAAGAAAAYFIRSDDSERLVGNSREVYYEQLPRGLTRQVITRPNGTRVITVENEYGDVIQRSRIAPDGRETVLFYDPYAEDDTRPDYYYDAGADLPPLRLEIPEDRYIVDVSTPDEELYYDTLVAPPVETVERIYSLNEVRRSPRIRDKVRRIDLNTINFAFGSAEIEQSEVDNLQALADAVKRVVDRNPGEVFLLEGHTDAVGSNVANLALSDRRAEAVAKALTDYFEIPSENLVTQGYGEEDLKVDTQSASRENRRVTLRRITPLVKPVETSQAN